MDEQAMCGASAYKPVSIRRKHASAAEIQRIPPGAESDEVVNHPAHRCLTTIAVLTATDNASRLPSLATSTRRAKSPQP